MYWNFCRQVALTNLSQVDVGLNEIYLCNIAPHHQQQHDASVFLKTHCGNKDLHTESETDAGDTVELQQNKRTYGSKSTYENDISEEILYISNYSSCRVGFSDIMLPPESASLLFLNAAIVNCNSILFLSTVHALLSINQIYVKSFHETLKTFLIFVTQSSAWASAAGAVAPLDFHTWYICSIFRSFFALFFVASPPLGEA